MSLYNAINGMNPATFFILPMLGKYYSEYPRFRDCFIGELENSDENDQFGIPQKKTSEEKVISVYTRVGGGNRDDYEDEIEELKNMPNYLRDYDDDFDNTFATFVFSVPEAYTEDFIKIKDGKINEISNEYKAELIRMFPTLTEKFSEIFSEK